MAERDRKAPSFDTRLEGRVLVISGIPRSTKELRRMGSCPIWELPFHAAMIATDFEGLVLERARNFLSNHHDNSEIPQGDGQPVVLETGLAGWKGTLGYLGRRLEENDWRAYYAEFRHLLNWEYLEMREESLLEKTRQANEETGKKAHWGLQSKALGEGLVACLKHPDEVKKRVKSIVALGPPLGRLNPLIVWVYSRTQEVNRLVFRRDDIDFFSQFGDEVRIEIPEGVDFIPIDIRTKGIIQSENGSLPGTRFVGGSHIGMGFREEVFRTMVQSFAESGLQKAA